MDATQVSSRLTFKMIEKYNNPNFIPYSRVFKTLHEDYAKSFSLPLTELKLTRDKAVDVLSAVCLQLLQMVLCYELSGNGAGQRAETAADFGYLILSSVCQWW